MVKSIYLAKIQFSNLSKTKIRPILIIKKNIFGDFIYMPLTSNLNVEGIKINNLVISFQFTNLPVYQFTNLQRGING